MSSVSSRSPLRFGLIALGLAASVLLGAVVVGPAGADPLSEKRAEAAQIGARLAELEARVHEIDGQFEQANYELKLAQDRVAAARQLAVQTAAEAAKRREDLRRYA